MKIMEPRCRRRIIALAIIAFVGIWLGGDYYYENIFGIVYLPDLHRSQRLPHPHVKWSYKTEYPIDWISVGADGAIHAANDATIYGIDANGNGKSSVLNSAKGARIIYLDNEGGIYLQSPEMIYAIDRIGNPKWTFQIGLSPSVVTQGSDGTLYAGDVAGVSVGGHLYAIRRDGRPKWIYRIDAGVRSLTAAADGMVYAGSSDGLVYALDSNGNRKWTFKTGAGGIADTAEAAWREFYQLKGNPIQFSFDPGRLVYSLKVGRDGTVYAGVGDGRVYSIASNGKLKWSFETRSHSVSSAYNTKQTDRLIQMLALGRDNTVYAVSQSMDTSMCGGNSGEPWNGRVYAIGPDGHRKWVADTEAFITSISVDGEGTVYIAAYAGVTNDGGHVYAIGADGTPKWNFSTGYRFRPFAAGSDGMVYAAYATGADDVEVYPSHESSRICALTPP